MKTMHSGRAPHASSAGFVLTAALLLVVMLSALSVGLYYIVTTESRLGMTDLDNSVAYYGAEAGMEKMAADLSALYSAMQVPCVADITGLGGTSNGPTLPGITYPDYSITVPNTGPCTLDTVTRIISSGSNEGLFAMITPMTFSVTARHAGAAEVKMSRTIELGPVNTNGHNHVTMRRWNSRKLNTNGSRHTCWCSAATSAFRTSRCSTPSCMSPSMAANGAGYPHGLATGTPSTPA